MRTFDDFANVEHNFMKDLEKWFIPEKFHLATDTGLMGNQVYDPKKIHEMVNNVHIMAPSFDKLSAEMKKHIISLMELSPTKIYIFWSQKAIDALVAQTCDAETQYAYELIEPKYGPAKSDFVRPIIQYLFGGTYHDIKSGMAHPERLESFRMCHS